MKKLGFVAPWYGDRIPGGAEMEMRELVKHLIRAGTDTEVLTTCVREFNSDWSADYHKPGRTVENGVPVRRFRAKRCDRAQFGMINYKLMNGVPVTLEEERVFMEQMVNSRDLYGYIGDHSEEYHAFIFMPYMFGTTYYGCLECPEKAVLIPCFHDESYAYMNIYKEAFQRIRGIIYLAEPERELANRIFDLSGVKQAVLGAGLDTEIGGDAGRFRERFGIADPFILYAGRKDEGKNVHTLIRYFTLYKKRHDTGMKLVLIGGGELPVPEEMRAEILDLGYVETQEKYDACAASELMCQPSHNESFSLVIMESWLCGRPVLVHEACAVTGSFVRTTGGGLYFNDYCDFEGCVDYLLNHEETAARMGENGKAYVKRNFSWDVIIRKYLDFLS